METIIADLKSRLNAIDTTLEYEYLNDRDDTREYGRLLKERSILLKTLRKLERLYRFLRLPSWCSA